jgi:hypothetical protein
MLFILGLLLMWCEYVHTRVEGDFCTYDGYFVIGLIGRLLCSASLIHFAWFVLL